METGGYIKRFNSICARPLKVQAMLDRWTATDGWWAEVTPATFKDTVRSAEGIVRLTAVATEGCTDAFELVWLVAAQHHHIRSQIGGQVELDDLVQELVLSFMERPDRPKATALAVLKNSTQTHRRQRAHAGRRHSFETLDTVGTAAGTCLVELRETLKAEFGPTVVTKLELMAGGQSARSVNLAHHQRVPVKQYVRELQLAA